MGNYKHKIRISRAAFANTRTVRQGWKKAGDKRRRFQMLQNAKLGGPHPKLSSGIKRQKRKFVSRLVYGRKYIKGRNAVNRFFRSLK